MMRHLLSPVLVLAMHVLVLHPTVHTQNVLWQENFTPCGKQEPTSKCVNGGIRVDDWSFEIGDGQDHGGDNFRGWGNNERQCYTKDPNTIQVISNPKNASDGLLVITARRSRSGFDCNNLKGTKSTTTWSSARLHTRNKHSVMYTEGGLAGQEPVLVEARIKLPPAGKGLWSAFWMLPQSAKRCDFGCDGKYGAWPRSGELDILEAVNDMKQATATVHFMGSSNQAQYQGGNAKVPTGGDGFHVYGLLWSPSGVTFTLDGIVTYQMAPWQWNGWYKGKATNAPFDKPFYLILNLAVGGKLPGDPDSSTPDVAEMMVDWVRVTGGVVHETREEGTKPPEEGMATGAIAGIAVAGAIGLAAVLFIIRCQIITRREQLDKKEKSSEASDTPLPQAKPTSDSISSTPCKPALYHY